MPSTLRHARSTGAILIASGRVPNTTRTLDMAIQQIDFRSCRGPVNATVGAGDDLPMTARYSPVAVPTHKKEFQKHFCAVSIRAYLRPLSAIFVLHRDFKS